MPRAAIAYTIVLAAIAAALEVFLLARDGIDRDSMGRFAVLAAAAAIAQLFVVRVPRNQTYHTTIAFLVAAVLLLPAALLPLIALVQHVPDWIRRRHRLRYSVFNTLNHSLNMLAGAGVAALILRGSTDGSHDVWALAGAGVALTLVCTNHVLLAVVIRLTRGLSLRASGLFSVESLAADLVPAVLGIAFAAFWLWAPWLIPTTVVPLFPIQRSLGLLQKRLEPAGT